MFWKGGVMPPLAQTNVAPADGVTWVYANGGSEHLEANVAFTTFAFPLIDRKLDNAEIDFRWHKSCTNNRDIVRNIWVWVEYYSLGEDTVQVSNFNCIFTSLFISAAFWTTQTNTFHS